MMNFDTMDPSMGDYPPLDGGMEPSMDPHLNPGLLQDLDAEGLPVPGSEHLMEGMFSELHSAVSEGGVPVTAAHFDLQEEMLWTGNHRGHVTSFFGPTMVRHSSFQANTADDIRQIHSLETGVLFLSKCNLKCHTRGGLVMFDYPMDEGADMHSLLMTDNNTVLMGGLQNYAVEFDLNAMQETQKFNVEVPGVAIMRQTGRFFFCGHTSGKITLRDLRSFKTEHEFDAFSGSLSDFDVHGNLLAACGFSSRGMNGLACDRFLMVFDLRMMRAVTPLQVHVDPLFLRFIPTYTSRLAIISQTGQCQFCEPTGLANMADIFHVNAGGQVLMSFDVSSSKQALAFGDSGGIVHLWSDAPEVSFNDYSRESEFALPCIVDSLPQLDWNHDLLPLSLIPTPLTSTEQLLSDWSSAMATPSPRRPEASPSDTPLEAAQFDVSWKVPGLLYYAKRNHHPKYDLRIKNPIDASVLLTEASLARKQRKSHATFIPLMVSEMPQAGELVGLDAEFVTLNQEEAELRSDGTKSTIKPSQMSVARITCVRGQGANEGVPFIDDYISTQEQVVDYLTQYSGIKPGDLDAKISSKHLTTLKSTYLKLRFLIDTGVRFVGHGLQKDFRVINLLVLKDQVVDTVHLFHLPRKRMISLRFLAWYFLELNIQGETHDSIEDARTALALYRKYLELSRGGGNDEVRKVLKGLYEKGRQLDWKAPESEPQDPPQGAAVFPSVMGL
ncbi:PAN2-PAN3 deadenylation complex catalytic subunit PAN2 [Pseudochaenichthys georgianus]|uniref:PAN2-PAN3 deadenylation complex catalytic subunit PAN2 n=1 Tax=Pseudochaenichthys georgianus TaxID=52239 RepID=UPI001469CF39|nr:PAN2-PAN3 deadenylation complex catalytic subunit PAN2 [Pseudochaenichthys georgianus]